MSVKEKLYGRCDLKGKYTGTHTKQETVWGIVLASHCGDNSQHIFLPFSGLLDTNRERFFSNVQAALSSSGGIHFSC